MKTSILAVIALSLGVTDAFVAPTANKNNNGQQTIAMKAAGFNGPMNGGTDGSSYMKGQYGTVGVTGNPWGDTNPNAGHPPPMAPSAGGMPRAKGQIVTVTGGSLGSDKFLANGAATKWAGTTMMEPRVQRDDKMSRN